MKSVENMKFNHNPFIGQWICAEEFGDYEPLNLFHREEEKIDLAAHEESLKNQHMLVRKSFYLDSDVLSSNVTIRLTADDYYKLYINGHYVGQGPAPGYHFAYYYNEYNIQPYLQAGMNTIFLDVYYQGLINRVWNSGDYRQGMIADILADGKALLLSDSTWEYTMSKAYISKRITGYDTQFLEDFDSREKPQNWRPVFVKKETDYSFCKDPVVPLQVYEKEPVIVRSIEGDGWFYDFGTEITAGLHIRAIGRSGQRLRIICGEECDADGRVRYSMRCNCTYEEFWTLDDGKNNLEQYDYKAFRYVEVIPEDGASVVIQSLTAVVRHYPFRDDACTLISSDKVLEAVFKLCKTGVKYGCQEVYVDCPSREKGQYAGDLTITSASHLILTGDTSLLRKAIENQVQSLNIADGMLAVTPGSFMQEIADYSLQFPILVWRYYIYTGDKTFLRSMLEPCERLITYFKKFSRGDGLLEKVDEKWNLVDWPDNLRDGYDFPLTKPIGPGCHNVINAFYVGCVKYFEQIKQELDIPFSDEATELKKAFNRCFFRPETGIYADSETSSHSSVHSNCLPVFFGLHPDGSEKVLASFLRQKGMCCGVYMAYFLLKAMVRLEQYEDVYNLITSRQPNSWYNMVAEGGTACFEAWGKDQKWNTSLCHPWASSPVSLIVEDLIGIKPLTPGWSDLEVIPHLPSELEHLEATVTLPKGTVQFRYHRGQFDYKYFLIL